MLCIESDLRTVGALRDALMRVDGALPLSFAGLDGLAVHLRWGMRGPCVVIDEPGSLADPDYEPDDDDDLSSWL